MFSYIVKEIDQLVGGTKSTSTLYSHVPIAKGDEIELFGKEKFCTVIRVQHRLTDNITTEPVLYVK